MNTMANGFTERSPVSAQAATENSAYDMALAALQSWSRDPELNATMTVRELQAECKTELKAELKTELKHPLSEDTPRARGISVTISHGQPERHYFGYIRRDARPEVIERSIWNVMALLLSIEPAQPPATKRLPGKEATC